MTWLQVPLLLPLLLLPPLLLLLLLPATLTATAGPCQPCQSGTAANPGSSFFTQGSWPCGPTRVRMQAAGPRRCSVSCLTCGLLGHI